MEETEKRVIVDVDMGTDDYLALLFLLRAVRQVKIEAITCCTGNTSVDNVVNNVVRLLELEDRTDIPVYIGAHEPLIAPKQPQIHFHGLDGFGDLDLDTQPDLSIVKEEHAAVALNRIVNENPKEISIIAVGPLTNLALALKINKNFRDNIKDVWIMGGNNTGVGNCTASAEFNFYVDPEAVHITVECLRCPIYIFPWESCLKSNMTLDWRFNALHPSNPALQLLKRVDEKIYSVANYTDYLPCDAFLCFCFIDPQRRILKHTTHHVTIELNNGLTRGQLVLDHLKTKSANVVMIEEFDQELFKMLFIDMNSSM